MDAPEIEARLADLGQELQAAGVDRYIPDPQIQALNKIPATLNLVYP